MEEKCHCTPYIDDRVAEEPQPNSIEIDFGPVEVNTRSCKYLDLDRTVFKNEGKFVIKRDSNEHAIYDVFEFSKHEGDLRKNHNSKIKLFYKPTVAHEENVEVFDLIDSTSTVCKIFARGHSIAPILETSSKSIEFVISPMKKLVNRTFEIKNQSTVNAIFHFDLARSSGDVFMVEPLEGTIAGKKNLYVNVKFCPKDAGSYSKRLVCLVFNHEPLIIELFGYYTLDSKFNSNHVDFVPYPYSIQDTVGFEGYFSDVAEYRTVIPPISLSNIYIDFGRTLPNADGAKKCQVVSLTNNLPHNVEVVWPRDEDDVFVVTPATITVPPKESAFFECICTPKAAHKVFFQALTAQVFWFKKQSIFTINIQSAIPLTASLTFISHSFPENHSWISQVDVWPQIVTLHPVLPGYSSYGTFMLRCPGHLPVLFKLIAPKKSNVTMKPSMGLIRSCQIIAVQLRTKTAEMKIYGEQWFVQINDLEERLPVVIRAEASSFSVLLGTNNSINFGVVQEGCVEEVVAPLKNTSRFKFQFQFAYNEFVEIIPNKGAITPNDFLPIIFRYKCSKSGPNQWTIKSKFQVVQHLVQIVGEPYERIFTVQAKRFYSQLCSIPSNHDFGEVHWGSILSAELHLFNFGETKIYFQLSTMKDSHNTDEFQAVPEFGKVGPGEKIKIIFHGTAQTLGLHNVRIAYRTRIRDESADLTDADPIDLFFIHYSCSYPIIQIMEVVEHNFGGLFTTANIWDLFQMDNFNKVLKKVVSGHDESAKFYVPDIEVNNREFYVTLLVGNISKHDTEVHVKRKKVCTCKLLQVEDNCIGGRKKIFDCPHRDMLHVQFVDTKIFAHLTQLLTIKLNYLLPNKTEMAYILEMSNNRRVHMHFHINAIPENTPTISTYKLNFEMKLHNVFVGERTAPLQMYWLYNNTKKIIPYKLEVTKIVNLCVNEEFPVLECHNPTGFLQPYNFLPIIFCFHPIETKIYNISVPLTLGDRTVEFHITGSGSIKRNLQKLWTRQEKKTVISGVPQNFPVTLSTDYIEFEPFPVWNTVEKMFLMKNVTKDKVIQYSWGQCDIEQVVSVKTTLNRKGLLNPKETHAIKITMKSMGLPCIAQLSLSCRVIDYTKMLLSISSMKEHSLRDEQRKKEFVITETGVSYPANHVERVPPPEEAFVTITLCVHIVNVDDLTAREQYKHTPQAELGYKGHGQTNRSKAIKIDKNHSKFIKLFMECLISDFVFSDLFMEGMKKSYEDPPPFYSQFAMLRRDVKNKQTELLGEKQKSKIFAWPKSREVSKIMASLVSGAVRETFKLG